MEEFDVVIVGAGPAGLNCARFLDPDENGLSVLVVDRKKEIGVPVQCGEAVPVKETYLDGMPGLEDYFADLYRAPGLFPLYEGSLAQMISGIRVIAPNRRSVLLRGDGCGIMLYRDRWEKSMAEDVVSRGAEIRLSTPYKDGLEGVSGKVVVGADGVFSGVAKHHGLSMNKEYAVCSLAHIDRPAEYFDIGGDECCIYLSRRFGQGYAWAFPQADGMNVGVGSINKRNTRAMLEEFLFMLDIPLNRVKAWGGGCDPLGGPLERIVDVENNVALIGDAAGLVYPLHGGGIMPALVSGAVLGVELVRWGDCRGRLASYDMYMKELLYPSLRKSLLYKRLFGSFGRWDMLTNLMVGVVGEKRLGRVMLGK